jgi:hypothetical protein
VVSKADLRDHDRPRIGTSSRDASRGTSEDRMVARIGKRDPFWDDGKGARRRQLRLRIEGLFALLLAIGACGLTVAMWLRQVGPAIGGLHLI